MGKSLIPMALMPKRWRPNPDAGLTLPERAQRHLERERESRLLDARVRYGFNVRHISDTRMAPEEGRGHPDVAMTIPERGDGVDMVTAMLATPPDMLELVESRTPNFAVTLLSVPAQTRRFTDLLDQAESELSWEERYARMLKLARAHFLARPPSSRVAFVTGDCFHTMRVEEGAPNSTAGGQLLSYEAYGRLLWSLIAGTPLSLEGQCYMHPLLYADGCVGFEDEHYVIGGNTNQKHALWALVPDQDPGTLERLQSIPGVHLHFFFHNSGKGGIWGWAVARSHGTQEELADMETALGTCGQVYRIPNWELPFGGNMESACFGALPGNPNPPPGAKHFSIPQWDTILPHFVSGVDASKVHVGDWPIGVTPGRLPQSVFIDGLEYGSLGIVGPTKAGKSVMALHLALLRTHRVIGVLLTSGVDDMKLGRFIRSIGGQFRNVELDSPKNATQWTESVERVEKEIDAWLTSMTAEWQRTGVASGLPLILRLQSGSKVLYTYYVTYFLGKIKEMMRDFYEQTDKRFMLLVDDLIGIPGKVPDEHLKEISVEKGDALRELLDSMKNDIRKYGAGIIFTFHSKEEMNRWPDGFWSTLPLCLELMLGVQHSIGGIWSPQHTDRAQMMPSYDPSSPWMPWTTRDTNAGFLGFFNPRLPDKTLALFLGKS